MPTCANPGLFAALLYAHRDFPAHKKAAHEGRLFNS